MEPLMEAQKEYAKKTERGKIIFILNQGCIENPAKSRRLFSQRSFIADI